MNDFDRLKTMLRRAARDGTAPSNRVEFAAAPAGVARMLEQVAASVLGQRITFAFEDGARVACEAAGRRLVRLSGPAPSRLVPEQAALFGRDELTPDDAQRLADLFVGLCERHSGFTAIAEPLCAEIGPGQSGIAPLAIAEAAGLPGDALFATGKDPSHDAFLDAIGPVLQAAILIEGDDASLIRGEGDAAAFIVEWADNAFNTLLTAGFPLLGTLETNGILAFALPESEGRNLLIAGRRGSLVIAAVRGGHLAETLDRWRALNLAPTK